MFASELLLHNRGSYTIPKSLRFVIGNAPVFSRAAPPVEDSTTVHTYSLWFKRGQISSGTPTVLISRVASATNFWKISIDADQLFIYQYNSAIQMSKSSTRLLRDPNAWYHIVVASDSTLATAEDRMKLYVNGVRNTNWDGNTQLIQNNALFGTWGAGDMHIGRYQPGFAAGPQQFDGQIAEVYRIDGQQLTADDFGQFDSLTGQWVPKAYSGNFGSSGFYLPFSDASDVTDVTLGKDHGPNNLNFTPTNFSATAGTTLDILNESPTDYYDGANYHGNFAILDSLAPNTVATTVDNTGMHVTLGGTAGSNAHGVVGNMRVSTGKYYMEFTVGATAATGAIYPFMGLTEYPDRVGFNVDGTMSYSVRSNGNKNTPSGQNAAYGTAFAVGDICMMAANLDDGLIWFGKNGSWFASGNPATLANPASIISPITSNGFTFAVSGDGNAAAWINTGQRAFSYVPPVGYKPWCSFTMPEPALVKPQQAYAAGNYTGAASDTVITDLAFQPDFLWVKGNAATASNYLDSVRGPTNRLTGDATTTEGGLAGVSFDANGFTIPGNTAGISATGTEYHYLALLKNPAYGVEVVTWTGDGTTNRLVPHNLGGSPEAVIARGRSVATSWVMWHKDMAGNTSYNVLNAAAVETTTTFWGTGSFGPTDFMVSTTLNTNGQTYVAYLFRSIPGILKVGSITQNNSTNGKVAHLNFRPAMVFFRPNSAAQHYFTWDPKASYSPNPGNPVPRNVYGNVASADVAWNHDILSNGFKVRSASASVVARYIAFAESPLKYGRAY